MPFLGKMRMNEIRLSGFRRYLLYAVGEILLVMIGILLALEVSNWSDNRKDFAHGIEQVAAETVKSDFIHSHFS